MLILPYPAWRRSRQRAVLPSLACSLLLFRIRKIEKYSTNFIGLLAWTNQQPVQDTGTSGRARQVRPGRMRCCLHRTQQQPLVFQRHRVQLCCAFFPEHEQGTTIYNAKKNNRHWTECPCWRQRTIVFQLQLASSASATHFFISRIRPTCRRRFSSHIISLTQGMSGNMSKYPILL